MPRRGLRSLFEHPDERIDQAMAACQEVGTEVVATLVGGPDRLYSTPVGEHDSNPNDEREGRHEPESGAKRARKPRHGRYYCIDHLFDPTVVGCRPFLDRLTVHLPIDTKRPPYWPALDGLRALAVAAVIFYHGGQDWAAGGFLGVDAFFVLSGFLITSLLVREWSRSGTIHFGAFWVRRARRLLPALFLVLIGIVVFAAVLVAPSDLRRIRADSISSIAYVANWRFVFSGQSYFDQFGAPSPLRHLWSLSIEEQFYLVWPVVVFLTLRVSQGSLRVLLSMIAVLATASVVTMALLYRPDTDPSRVYYGTDTRAQSILVGAAVAVLIARFGGPRSRAATIAMRTACALGALYTLWAWTTLDDRSDWLYRGGLTVGAISVAAVIASVVQRDPGMVGRVLSLQPLRWVGQISYGLYLWHWPLFLVLTRRRTGIDGFALLGTRLGATVAAATASYYLLEMPIRRGAVRSWRGLVALPAAAVLLIGAFVVVTIDAPRSIAETAADPKTRSPSDEQQRLLASRAPVRVAVVGDSVAFSLSLGLQALPADKNVIAWNRAQLGCSLERRGDAYVGGQLALRNPGCDWAEQWRDLPEAIDPDVVVMLFGAWDVLDFVIDGQPFPLASPARDRYFLSELDAAVALLESQGSRVVVLTVPYFQRPELDTQQIWTEYQPWRVDHVNDLLRRWSKEHPRRATLIDLNHFVSPRGEFTDVIDGVVVRGDGVHFTAEGAALVAKWLAPQIRETAALAPPSDPENE